MILPINNITNNNYHKNKQKKVPYINFKAVRLLSVGDKFKQLEPSLLEEITTFQSKKNNAKYLGQGLFSKVYELLKLPNIVIKESMGRDNFEQEDKGLKNAPESLQSSQQFVARAYDDETFKFYILSTMVKGESASPIKNPWNRETLEKLFEGMFEMDKIGFYHGDLNDGNVKIDKNGNVNFLDYQWATKLEYYGDQFDEKKEQCLPEFIPTLNAQMFEMAEIPHYLRLLKDEKMDRLAFMGTYLSEKAKYHMKRANFFGNNVQLLKHLTKADINEKVAIEFDKAQGMILNNASLATIKLEAKKIQFLASFREAYRHVDPNTPIKNPLNAPSAYLVALNNVQWFRKEVEKQKQGIEPDSYEFDYLKGMERYGNYWFEKLSKWSLDALSCGIHLAKISPYFDGIPKGLDIEKFRSITCFLDSIDKNYMPKYTKNLEFTDSSIEERVENLEKSMIEDYFIKDETLLALNKLRNSLKDKKGLTALNNALILHRRINEEIHAKYSKKEKYNNESLSGFAFYPNNESENLSQKIVEDIFHKLINQIINTPLKTDEYYGYEMMNKF